MEWTLVEDASRLIVAVGSSRRAPEVPAGHTLLQGPRGDPRIEWATVALDGLEPRPALSLTALPAVIGVGEAVTVTVTEAVAVYVGTEHVGELPAGGGTLSFEEPGAYTVRFRPASTSSGSLAVEVPLTVMAGGTAVATDLLVAERPTSLAADVRAKLAQLDLAISRAQAREAAAEEIRTRTITTQAQAVAALRDLAAIERQTNNDLAAVLQHTRRSFFALVEIATRR